MAPNSRGHAWGSLVVACALLLLAAVPAPADEAPPPDPGRDALIAELMDLSGTDAMLAQLPAALQAELDQSPAPDVDPDTYALLRTVLLEAYRSASLRRTLVDNLARQYDPGRFRSFRDLLASPLARKMTSLELAAGSPEAQAEMNRNTPAILAAATPARLALVRRLDEVIHATEMTTDLSMLPLRAVATMHFPLLPEAERQRQQAVVDEAMEQVRPEVHDSVHQSVLVSFLYGYRSVSDAELGRYVDLLDSDLGRGWVSLSNDAFVGAVRQAEHHAAAEAMRRMMGGTEI
jgi:hypothetical protein